MFRSLYVVHCKGVLNSGEGQPIRSDVSTCSLKIHICSDDAERETLLAISLGQLSLKTFRLPSGVESVSQRFGQTSSPSVLVILLSGAIPVPSLQIRSAG
jgi:hypothetical protein